MRSFWSDPYLWIHLAGLSAFPLLIEGCFVGFALGDPFLPVWLELLLVATAGIAPILWMQWQRPFYIFSLAAVCLKPAALTDDQRRLLTLFKSSRSRGLAVLASIALAAVLWKVYALAPIAEASVLFLPASRLLGLLVAAAAFLACNLFVQVPLSVVSVMLTGESTFAQTVPYPQERIRQSFSLIGLPLNKILPPVVTVPPPIAPHAATAAATAAINSIGTEAPTLTEALADDLWADDAAASASSPTASDASVLGMAADTAERPDQVPESSTMREDSSLAENALMADRSVKDTPIEPSSEPERNDREPEYDTRGL